MSYDQWKYGTNFSSYGAFEWKLFKNTFVAFIMKHPVIPENLQICNRKAYGHNAQCDIAGMDSTRQIGFT